MRIFVGVLWLIVFLLLFGFALNNTGPAELRFFAGAAVRAPLVALLLMFFFGGVVFGVIAMLPLWFRQRIALRRLHRAQPPVAGLVAGKASAPAAESIQSVAQGARTTT